MPFVQKQIFFLVHFYRSKGGFRPLNPYFNNAALYLDPLSILRVGSAEDFEYGGDESHPHHEDQPADDVHRG